MSRHGCLPRSRRSATSDFSSPRSRDRRHRRFGQGAYRGIHEKAAALLHSFARSHALVDGNKRLALAATIAFCGMNGCASRSGMGPKGPGPTEIQALAQLAVDLLDPLCKLSLRQSVQLWADVEDAVAHRVGCLGDDRGRSADVAPGVPLAYAIEHVTD